MEPLRMSESKTVDYPFKTHRAPAVQIREDALRQSIHHVDECFRIKLPGKFSTNSDSGGIRCRNLF